jgi:hypothetical protein
MMTNQNAAPRLSRRSLAVGGGIAAISLAGWRGVSAQQAGSSQGQLQPSANGAGITVTGNGRATADVDSAILQFLVRYSIEAAQAQGSAGGSGYYGGTEIPAPDDDALTNVINAIVDAGVPREQIVTAIGSNALYGMFGPGVSVIGAQLDIEQIPELNELVANVTEAGKATDLSFDQAGVVFSTADCDAVSDAAYLAAIEDGRIQAEAVARALGAELGELVGVTAFTPWSAYTRYDGGGSGNGCSTAFELFDALTNYFPSYVPGAEPTFALSVSVSLTFEFAGSE